MNKAPSFAEVKKTLQDITMEMTEIWFLFQDSKFLLSEAERHAESDAFRCSVYSRAATIHSVFALEAFLRAMLNPRLAKPFIPIDYESFRTFKDRAQFLHYMVAGHFLMENERRWQAVCRAIRLRNMLAHLRPSKPARKLSIKEAKEAVMACLAFVGIISRAIGKKPPEMDNKCAARAC